MRTIAGPSWSGFTWKSSGRDSSITRVPSLSAPLVLLKGSAPISVAAIPLRISPAMKSPVPTIFATNCVAGDS